METGRSRNIHIGDSEMKKPTTWDRDIETPLHGDREMEKHQHEDWEMKKPTTWRHGDEETIFMGTGR
jgi:hypothetical protein